MNTGISKEETMKIASGVSSVLADTYTLYLMTQNFHWNVSGPRFYELHKMFEDEYRELAESVDEIAERIRALGVKAPGTFKEFLEATSLKEPKSDLDANKMVEKLLEGHETIACKAREVIHMASAVNDEATVDLLASRIKSHEKTTWMLRNVLQ